MLGVRKTVFRENPKAKIQEQASEEPGNLEMLLEQDLLRDRRPLYVVQQGSGGGGVP